MPHLASVSAKKLIAMLERDGFVCVRTKGSHHYFLNKVTKKTTVIPAHSNRDIGTGLLRAILRDIGTSVDDFNHKMKR